MAISQQNQNNSSPHSWGFKEWFEIAAIVLGLVFAGWSVYLTVLYGDSREQTDRLDRLIVEQQHQIKGLDNLAARQQASVDTLVDILNELRTSNELAASQTSELKNQTSELKNQTSKVSRQSDLVFDQLKISQHQQEFQNEQYKIDMNSNHILYDAALDKISDEINSNRGYSGEIDTSTVRRLTLINKIETIVAGQLNNPYVLRNDSLYKKTKQLYSEVREYRRWFAMSSADWLVYSTTILRNAPDTGFQKALTLRAQNYRNFTSVYHIIYSYLLPYLQQKSHNSKLK